MTSIAQQIRDGIGSLTTAEVHVEEWGCTIELQELTGTLLERWEQAHREWIGRKANTKIDSAGRAVIVGLSIVDEQRNRPFADKAGFSTLSESSADVLDRLYMECCKLNKFGGFANNDNEPEEDDVKKPAADQESDSGEN
jgi:hypothetical protein